MLMLQITMIWFLLLNSFFIKAATITIKGQCTIEGSEHRGQSTSTMTEMQQQSAQVLSQLNKQVHVMRGVLETSFQQLTAVRRILDVRSQDYDTDIRHQLWNAGDVRNVWDCSDIRAGGQSASGVYEVCVRHLRLRTCANVFCDMEDSNISSLVFQRRINGKVDFYRTWNEYKEGFGDLTGEFWLGNEMLYLLTSKQRYKLRIDLEDFEGGRRSAEYRIFAIGSSADNYTLEVGGYSGDAGDSLAVHNGMQFSTKDVDNDNANTSTCSCAQSYLGAWWYSKCLDSNLNGVYRTGNFSGSAKGGEGIVWHQWLGNLYSLKSTQMKLVPLA